MRRSTDAPSDLPRPGRRDRACGRPARADGRRDRSDRALRSLRAKRRRPDSAAGRSGRSAPSPSRPDRVDPDPPSPHLDQASGDPSAILTYGRGELTLGSVVVPPIYAIIPGALFSVTAIGFIIAAEPDRPRLTWTTKPFMMPLLAIAYVIAAAHPNYIIVAGLLLGAVGDVALIGAASPRRFIVGLAAFLLGHVAYIVAFLQPVLVSGAITASGEAAASGGTVWPYFLAAVPLAALGAATYRVLSPGLGTMRVPVVAYIVIIVTTALAAVLRFPTTGGAAGWLPVAGALSFLISDAALAYRRFRTPIPGSGTVCAVGYVVAQGLIVAGFLVESG